MMVNWVFDDGNDATANFSNNKTENCTRTYAEFLAELASCRADENVFFDYLAQFKQVNTSGRVGNLRNKCRSYLYSTSSIHGIGGPRMLQAQCHRSQPQIMTTGWT